MVHIKPFRAIRPTRDKASLVASRSYVSYSKKSLIEKLNSNPYTFLHIINPDYKNNNRLKTSERFQAIRRKYDEFINNKYIKKDEQEYFYIYKQIKSGIESTGIINAISINDYLSGRIKIHEETILKREELFKEYLKITQFNAEPVLLTYADNQRINNITQNYCKDRPEYEFTTTNGVKHMLWVISKKEDIENIEKEFSKIDNVYIADGHHRCASSALLSKEITRKNNNHNFLMSCLVPESQLRILNFNRIIENIPEIAEEDLIAKIQEYYNVKNQGKNIFIPSLKNEISMYFRRTWYSLIAKNKQYTSISASLDPSILSNTILKNIFNIESERDHPDISFLDGNISPAIIQEKVDREKNSIAFILKPLKIKDLKDVADNREIMPPKSTYIEPKLRSGLTIYEI